MYGDFEYILGFIYFCGNPLMPIFIFNLTLNVFCPKGIKKVEEKPEFEKSNKPKGSSVVRLPKLVEENGLATPSAASNGNLNSASTTSKRPQLAKVHKHLESVDFEDQEKIYVVEVS